VLFCPPSAEALRLLRWFPGLVSPPDGRGSLSARTVRAILVAPYTQLTFLSFDLQVFLFDVLHTSRVALAGHLFGMTAVNLLLLALVSSLTGSIWGGGLLALVLLLWYAAVAHSAGLHLWWLVMVPVVSALWGASTFFVDAGPGALLLATLGAAGGVSLSHATEPLFPPRAGDPLRWLTVRRYIFGPIEQPHSRGLTVRHILRVGAYPFIGLVDELWASPRLLPYNFLRLMLAAGYAPKTRQMLDERRDRAWASGNPALDFVGIGGGAFLVPPSR
jgi:hypothetical protein